MNFIFSTTSKKSASESRSEAAQILKNSKQKPVAAVKPMVRAEESVPVNLLGDILSCQDKFLKPSNRSTIVPKVPKKPNPFVEEEDEVIFIYLQIFVFFKMTPAPNFGLRIEILMVFLKNIDFSYRCTVW